MTLGACSPRARMRPVTRSRRLPHSNSLRMLSPDWVNACQDQQRPTHGPATADRRRQPRPARPPRCPAEVPRGLRRPHANPGERPPDLRAATRHGALGAGGDGRRPNSSRRRRRRQQSSSRSALTGRERRTAKPRDRASAVAAFQSVVLPMPGSPSSSSAAGPPVAKKERISASSRPRPMTSSSPIRTRPCRSSIARSTLRRRGWPPARADSDCTAIAGAFREYCLRRQSSCPAPPLSGKLAAARSHRYTYRGSAFRSRSTKRCAAKGAPSLTLRRFKTPRRRSPPTPRPLQQPPATPLAQPPTAGGFHAHAPHGASIDCRHRAARPTRRPHPRIHPRRVNRVCAPFTRGSTTGAPNRSRATQSQPGSPSRRLRLTASALAVAVRSVWTGGVRPDHIGQICTVQVRARQVGSG